jgi:hypothetical protein
MRWIVPVDILGRRGRVITSRLQRSRLHACSLSRRLSNRRTSAQSLWLVVVMVAALRLHAAMMVMMMVLHDLHIGERHRGAFVPSRRRISPFTVRRVAILRKHSHSRPKAGASPLRTGIARACVCCRNTSEAEAALSARETKMKLQTELKRRSDGDMRIRAFGQRHQATMISVR